MQRAWLLADGSMVDARGMASFHMGDEITVWPPRNHCQLIPGCAKRRNHPVELDRVTGATARDHPDSAFGESNSCDARRRYAQLIRRTRLARVGGGKALEPGD